MASSLISTIRQAIFTETSSNVSINQRSLVSILVAKSGEGDAFSLKDFKCKRYRGKSLVVSRHILHFLKVLVFGLIWCVYAIYNLLHRIFTGKWRGMKSSSGINIIILTLVAIFGIVSLLYILMFLIRDVVLAPNNAYVNPKGVVTVVQPCYETQSFFLLNAATYWTSTDIHISEGDRVYITASGSMYSDIGEVVEAAKANRKLNYQRSSFGTTKPSPLDTMNVQYCIYGRYVKDRKKNVNEDARFGSLLYQIAQPHGGPIGYNTDDNPNDVQQVDFFNKRGKSKVYNFKAEKSGTLYLTFNDILLDDKTIYALVRNKPDNMWKDIDENISEEVSNLKRLRFLSPPKTDGSIPKLVVNMESDFMNIYDTVAAISNHIKSRQIWFQDNVGEVLVNVRVEKNIWKSDMRWYKKTACSFYRYVDHCWNKPFGESLLPRIILFVVLYFGLDITVSAILKRRETTARNKSNIY